MATAAFPCLKPSTAWACLPRVCRDGEGSAAVSPGVLSQHAGVVSPASVAVRTDSFVGVLLMCVAQWFVVGASKWAALLCWGSHGQRSL